jgi:hypothetical protein
MLRLRKCSENVEIKRVPSSQIRKYCIVSVSKLDARKYEFFHPNIPRNSISLVPLMASLRRSVQTGPGPEFATPSRVTQRYRLQIPQQFYSYVLYHSIPQISYNKYSEKKLTECRKKKFF